MKIPIQNQVAEQLTKLSGYDDYTLFLCNSGAEANENAIKLASFHTGKRKLFIFLELSTEELRCCCLYRQSENCSAPVNQSENFVKLPFNDLEALKMNSKPIQILLESL